MRERRKQRAFHCSRDDRHDRRQCVGDGVVGDGARGVETREEQLLGLRQQRDDERRNHQRDSESEHRPEEVAAGRGVRHLGQQHAGLLKVQEQIQGVRCSNHHYGADETAAHPDYDWNQSDLEHAADGVDDGNRAESESDHLRRVKNGRRVLGKETERGDGERSGGGVLQVRRQPKGMDNDRLGK